MVTARPMVEGSKLSSDDWVTPSWLADLVGKWDFDPCSNKRSHIQAGFNCSIEENHPGWLGPDGLADGIFDGQDGWWGSVWCNPPFSNVLPWAYRLSIHRAPWCALVKLDPTTRWWRQMMTSHPIVAPFKKRLTFEGDKKMTANFPCALVYRAWAPSRELEQHLWIARWA